MYAMAMADERGKNPTDDIVTTLIQADIDGEKLSDDEFGYKWVIVRDDEKHQAEVVAVESKGQDPAA